jgi:hypothetical protein
MFHIVFCPGIEESYESVSADNSHNAPKFGKEQSDEVDAMKKT